MSATEESVNRRAKRRKIRKERSARIERAWVNHVEAYAPYEPGDLMSPYEEKKKKRRK